MYRVYLKPRAEKQFAKLPDDLRQKFFDNFKNLSSGVFGANVKKIQGTHIGYRLRIGR